jgi:Domain of unknown function (DUF4112)
MAARQRHDRYAAAASAGDPKADQPKVHHRRVERLRQLAYLLDDRFRIPGTKYRIGLDGLVGLVPGVGDAVTTLISLYIVLEARRLGLPVSKLGRMGLNVGLDAVLGAVPLVGDLFDVAWKANRRNVALLLDHLEADRRTRHAGRHERVDPDPAPNSRKL